MKPPVMHDDERRTTATKASSIPLIQRVSNLEEANLQAEKHTEHQRVETQERLARLESVIFGEAYSPSPRPILQDVSTSYRH
jgi:hypothetical protein